jgi:hypothetical protein
MADRPAAAVAPWNPALAAVVAAEARVLRRLPQELAGLLD